jgi:hypothetical protein
MGWTTSTLDGLSGHDVTAVGLGAEAFGHWRKTSMVRGYSGPTSIRWPFHSAYFWCGLLAGVGIGLLLGAALVELEVLTSQRKAWASLLGAGLVGVGGLVCWRGQSGRQSGAESTNDQPAAMIDLPGLGGAAVSC